MLDVGNNTNYLYTYYMYGTCVHVHMTYIYTYIPCILHAIYMYMNMYFNFFDILNSIDGIHT